MWVCLCIPRHIHCSCCTAMAYAHITMYTSIWASFLCLFYNSYICLDNTTWHISTCFVVLIFAHLPSLCIEISLYIVQWVLHSQVQAELAISVSGNQEYSSFKSRVGWLADANYNGGWFSSVGHIPLSSRPDQTTTLFVHSSYNQSTLFFQKSAHVSEPQTTIYL